MRLAERLMTKFIQKSMIMTCTVCKEPAREWRLSFCLRQIAGHCRDECISVVSYNKNDCTQSGNCTMTGCFVVVIRTVSGHVIENYCCRLTGLLAHVDKNAK